MDWDKLLAEVQKTLPDIKQVKQAQLSYITRLAGLLGFNKKQTLRLLRNMAALATYWQGDYEDKPDQQESPPEGQRFTKEIQAEALVCEACGSTFTANVSCYSLGGHVISRGAPKICPLCKRSNDYLVLLTYLEEVVLAARGLPCTLKMGSHPISRELRHALFAALIEFALDYPEESYSHREFKEQFQSYLPVFIEMRKLLGKAENV